MTQQPVDPPQIPDGIWDQHKALLLQLDKPDEVDLEQVRTFLKLLAKAGASVDDAEERFTLHELIRYWASFIDNKTGEFPIIQLQPFDTSLKRTSAALEHQLEPQHPKTADSLNNLAQPYQNRQSLLEDKPPEEYVDNPVTDDTPIGPTQPLPNTDLITTTVPPISPRLRRGPLHPRYLFAAELVVISLLALLVGSFLIQSASSPSLPIPTFCIGTDFAISGIEAINDISLRNGADLAITQNHDLGSGYTLNACDKDDVSHITGIHDPAVGVQNVKQLIADKTVLGLVGPGDSNIAQAEIPVAAQAGLVVVSPSATNPCLTLQQYCTYPGQEQVHPSGVPNSFFRICSNDLRQGQVDADLFFKSLGLRRAFVVDDGEVYGLGLADAFIQRLNNDGGTVLGRDHILNGNVTTQLVQTAVSSMPDAVFYGGDASTGGGHLKAQLVQAGFTSPMIGGDGIASHDLFLIDAGSAASNTYATALGPDVSVLPQWYIQAYQSSYGGQPSSASASAGSYDAAMVLITAIKSVIKTNPQVMHSDVGTIRKAVLEKVKHPDHPYQGLTGTITFDSNGDNAALTVFTVYAVENGQWVYKPEFAVKG